MLGLLGFVWVVEICWHCWDLLGLFGFVDLVRACWWACLGLFGSLKFVGLVGVAGSWLGFVGIAGCCWVSWSLLGLCGFVRVAGTC